MRFIPLRVLLSAKPSRVFGEAIIPVNTRDSDREDESGNGERVENTSQALIEDSPQALIAP